MKATPGNKPRLIGLATLAVLIAAVLSLAGFLAIADAQSEDPILPSDVTITEGAKSADIPDVNTVNLGPEWRRIFMEDFEATNWVDQWEVNLDIGSAGTGLKWGSQTIVNSLDPSSTKSGWGICADESCSNVDPFAPSYPAGVQSFLVAGPFDLSRADDALIDLDLFYEANTNDKFTVSVSENRYSYVVVSTVTGNVDDGSWQEKTVSLTDYIGKDQIWIAFTFESAAAASKMGAMMDDISVWTEGEAGMLMPIIINDFTATPPPATATPTATATPPATGGDFEQNFTNSISPWAARRWSLNTEYSITHDGGSDDGRQGFLNVNVNTANSKYVIVSPLVPGPKPPYNIETTVKLRSERNTGDQYGIIFGANYLGGTCPDVAANFNTCFTHYYEMRVRYYYDDSADKERMEMKLKRIDSHDSNNNNSGPDLIEWTRVRDVDESGFIEWDVTVEENGKIKISANDLPVASATDSTYINNVYFGVIVRTEDAKNAEAKFDYYKIDGFN